MKYPRHACELDEPCSRKVVAAMLRSRRYSLLETRYRKDKGVVKLYMYDSWADPMQVHIGEFCDGQEPDWGAVYDAAMAVHEGRKSARNRYGD